MRIGYGALILAALLSSTLTGCGSVLGVKHADIWGAKFDFTTGMDVSAGIQQYDHVLDRKGMNVEAKDNKVVQSY